MPKNKDFKRLARKRMLKTGESYTTARAQLLEKRRTAKAVEEKRSAPETPTTQQPRADYAALAGMRDTAVHAKTGRTWAQWVQVLDAADAMKMSHRDIAQHVYDEYSIDGWWAQTVTVGYERIRGLRDIGQRRGGSYDANKSKTFPVSVDQLFAAFSEARRRKRWLQEAGITVRKAAPHHSVRMTWPDGTCVVVNLTAKGETKSQAAIQHGKLASKAEAERMKQFWDERLGALATILAPAKTARR